MCGFQRAYPFSVRLWFPEPKTSDRGFGERYSEELLDTDVVYVSGDALNPAESRGDGDRRDLTNSYDHKENAHRNL